MPSMSSPAPDARRVGRTAALGVAAGLRLLPAPRGDGRTGANWRVLADAAAVDLSAARLAEAHLDAATIAVELGAEPAVPGSLWGVWAAESTGTSLRAGARAGRWCLQGTKPWCSGARLCTHALVTAHADDGLRLFAVDLGGEAVRPQDSDWTGTGMAATDTAPVVFEDAPATPVGGAGDYLGRPGFWHGAIGVSAAWFGGAVGALAPLLRRAADCRLDPHAAAHLGAADAALTAARAVLHDAADAVDPEPAETLDDARRRALRARAVVETAVETVLRGVGRATGPGPLAHDADHARHVADLQVYVRQSHAERDLAALGELAATQPMRW